MDARKTYLLKQQMKYEYTIRFMRSDEVAEMNNINKIYNKNSNKKSLYKIHSE